MPLPRSTRHTRPAALALAASVLAVLAGCSTGGSGEESTTGSGGDDATRVAEVRADLAALFAGDHPDARQTATGECFAEELTSTTSLDALQAAGVLDSSYDVVADLPRLREDVAEAWAEAQFACTDFVEESTRAQQAATKGRILDEPYAACLRDELTPEQMRAAVVDSLTGNWQGVDLMRLGRAQSECQKSSLAPR